MQLVIVESPTKARKLSEYLGKDFVVEASIGHVRDLPKKTLGVDLDHDFEPTYIVDPTKQPLVDKLKKLAKGADKIYLATDPDREGEAIAWHIKELLTTPTSDFVRSTFHEITKSAVMDAIAHPGTISTDLVDAQQARRVVDRLVGYQVSPVLWRKVRRGLSAGRVQSVALRMIVEREREIAAFKPEEYWEVDVLLAIDEKAASSTTFDLKGLTDVQKAALPKDFLLARVISINDKKYEPHAKADVDTVVNDLQTDAVYQVSQVEKKSRERASLPPFTTSTLQQSAATRLGYTSKQTMALAQQLYEEGLITYHRTDSFNLSTSAVEMARGYISTQFGKNYIPEKPRYFATKSKNAQEAHEAIRVTEVKITGEGLPNKAKFTSRHTALYDLIWRRFLASQMSSAVYDQTSITITATPPAQKPVYTLRTGGSILRFDGWMKLFTSQEDVILPSVTENQPLFYNTLNAAQKFTLPPARYNDASLVKELEKRGIGRPSTYASIISVIVDRGYVERLEKRFTATSVGMTVNDFLMEHFKVFMDYDFTAEMEENLDRIARGEKQWRKVVKDFYTPLAKTIETVKETAQRKEIPVEETGEPCPLCGETDGGKIVIRSGKFGKFKSCNRFPECKFTENIVDKFEGMQCPLCHQGDVIIRKSRWGKPFYGCSRYPECDWASWSKPALDLQVTAEEWAVQKQARAEKKAARDAARGITAETTKAKPVKKTPARKKKKTAAKTKRTAAKP